MELRKALGAEVALVSIAVPGAFGGLVGIGPVPFYQMLRDEAAGILRAHELVERIAVDIGSAWAGAALEVVGDTGGCSVPGLAEGAGDAVGGPMSPRFEMLALGR